jgi:DNA (cytosine-5)-methyltransferase 1
MVEIDKNCQNILHRHFPNAKLYNDVKEVGNATHERRTVDLVCGGFPCQDLSVAGKRAGLAGERSGLWFEFARIIDELEPKWVVAENVPGLLSSDKGSDFAIIVRWLAERGYGVAWRVLDAQYFGVPQRRRRVFIVGSLGDGRAAEVLFEREGMSGNTPKGRKEGEGTPAATLRGFGHGWQGQHNDTNAVMVARENGQGYWMEDNISGTLDKNMGDSGHASRPAIVLQSTVGALQVRDAKGIATTIDDKLIWEMQHASEAYRPSQGGVAPTLQGRMGTGGNNVPLVGVRRLTPTECERLQGFPDGWTDGQSDSTRYRQLGNAVAVPVVEWIGKQIIAAPERQG